MMYYHIDVIADCLACKQERSVHIEFTSTNGILSHADSKPVNMFEGHCGRCRRIHNLLFDRFNVVSHLELTNKCEDRESGA